MAHASLVSGRFTDHCHDLFDPRCAAAPDPTGHRALGGYIARGAGRRGNRLIREPYRRRLLASQRIRRVVRGSRAGFVALEQVANSHCYSPRVPRWKRSIARARVSQGSCTPQISASRLFLWFQSRSRDSRWPRILVMQFAEHRFQAHGNSAPKHTASPCSWSNKPRPSKALYCYLVATVCLNSDLPRANRVATPQGGKPFDSYPVSRLSPRTALADLQSVGGRTERQVYILYLPLNLCLPDLSRTVVHFHV